MEKDNTCEAYKNDLLKKDNDYGQLALHSKSLTQQVKELNVEVVMRDEKIQEDSKNYETLKEDKLLQSYQYNGQIKKQNENIILKDK